MSKIEYSLYELFKKYSYSDLKQFFKDANSKEEQDFYMNLANLKLGQEQAKTIKLKDDEFDKMVDDIFDVYTEAFIALTQQEEIDKK